MASTSHVDHLTNQSALLSCLSNSVAVGLDSPKQLSLRSHELSLLPGSFKSSGMFIFVCHHSGLSAEMPRALTLHRQTRFSSGLSDPRLLPIFILFLLWENTIVSG